VKYLDVISISLLMALIVLMCIVAHKKRHKIPRTVLFFYCFLPFALGLGLLIITYIDFNLGKVMPIFFKGKVAVSKLDSPKLFFVGVVFDALFSLCIAAAGLVGMLIAVTNTKFKFKE
jgi:hypothetical protein